MYTQIPKPDSPDKSRVHVHLYDYHIEWLDNNNIQRSGCIRDLLDSIIVNNRTDLPDNQTTLTDYTQQ